MLHRSFDSRSARRGVVLLIVITMLALFATVALAFVFYAESESTGAALTRQAQVRTWPDSDPELLLSFFLRAAIYGDDNVYSALRGTEMARLMYGYNPYGANASAFSGIGRLHYKQNVLSFNPAAPADDYYFPNLQFYPTDQFPPAPLPGKRFIRDGEYYGSREPTIQRQPNPANYRAGNAPYTYPDLNNMFLAQVSADGSVIMPSYHRPWLIPYLANLAPSPLTKQNYKYATLLPDRANYHTKFVTPDSDAGGDVKNLDFSPGYKLPSGTGYANNDSYWLDLGYPVMIAPNGQKYKVLFAPLIMDLDNRLNLSVIGNGQPQPDPLTGAPTLTLNPSHKGYGPNEINPTVVSPTTGQPVMSAADLLQLLSFRYGGGPVPPPQAVSPTGAPPNRWPVRDGTYYSRIDFNGVNGGLLTLPNPYNPQYPAAAKPLFFVFPDYPQQPPYTGANFWYSANELPGHPLLYNIFLPGSPNRSPTRASDLEAILRYKGTGAPAVTSVLFKNLPKTFGSPNDRARGLLTSLSWSLDRISAAPYIPFTPGDPNPAWADPQAIWAYARPTGTPYPKLYNPTFMTPNPLKSPPFDGTYTPKGEFSSEFRSTLANRLRVSLNRISNGLTYVYLDPVTNKPVTQYQYDYPPLDPTTGIINLATVYPAPGSTPFPSWGAAGWTFGQQFIYAQQKRQQLATDIYNVLVLVTGAQNPNTPISTPTLVDPAPNSVPTTAPGSPAYLAAQWLAQLAVNIVDYIDNDDFITPFNWDRTNSTVTPVYVFGTETPRLVLNEAYAQLDNDPNDTSLPGAASKYNLNVWAELHNPFKPTPTGPPAEPYPFGAGTANLNVGNTATAAYQLVLCKTGAAVPDVKMRAPDNVRGDNNMTDPAATSPWYGVVAVANQWDPAVGLTNLTTVLPANGVFCEPNYQANSANGALANQGFYVVGPKTTFLADQMIGGVTVKSRNPLLPMTYQSPQMSVKRLPVDIPAAATPPNTTILLQRLACPYIAPNPAVPGGAIDPNKPYNPYITIDYIENVKTWDNRVYNETGAVAAPPPDEWKYYTVGRRQPYAAALSTLSGALPSLQPQQPFTTITAASNAMPLPQAVINVVSTTGFPSTGGSINITIAPGVQQLITYTALTPTQFTGCTGGAGMLMTGNPVTPASQPQNTFFRHNSLENASPTTNPITNPPLGLKQTLDIPFDWLTHLDRPVVNGLELFHVSGFHPHELTQQFITYTKDPMTGNIITTKFQQYAPWADHSAMIFRALEALGVPSYLNGTARGGRVPGKININTMNEIEIWMALCDQNATSSFPATFVPQTFGKLLQTRTPGDPTALPPIPPGVPSKNDVPFRSFGVGYISSMTAPPDTQYPKGSGLHDTLLRADPGAPGQRIMQNPTVIDPTTGAPKPAHPYQQWELLQKIYNNVTTTSNVFAVWLTVGFFEVVDDSVLPAKLGQEIGRDQGRHIRHRMFALIDRSGLNLAQGTTAAAVNAGTGVVININGVVLNTMKDNLVEFFDPTTGQTEVVTVTDVDCAKSAIKADLPRALPAKAQMIFRGNPGPQPRSLRSLTTAAVTGASPASTPVPVTGVVANIMVGKSVTVGPDPITGKSEIGVVTGVITTPPPPGVSPTTPVLSIVLKGNYAPGTPITWQDTTQYNPRNDPAVVPHFTIIQ
jgi:hypothetical protein